MNARNMVALVGRLTADPQLRYLPNGSPVANFAVAVNRAIRKPNGDFEDSLDGFFDCELFGGQAVALAENCKKGSEVQLTGSLLQKKFETKGSQPRTISKVEVRVTSIAPVLAVPRETEVTQSEEAAAPQPA